MQVGMAGFQRNCRSNRRIAFVGPGHGSIHEAQVPGMEESASKFHHTTSMQSHVIITIEKVRMILGSLVNAKANSIMGFYLSESIPRSSTHSRKVL